MPIKGLEARARLPRLGIIRLGIKTPNRNTPAGHRCDPGANCRLCHPEEVPYFVIPDELKALLGEDKPTKLSVLFPADEPSVVLQADYIAYAGKLLSVKCDGETCITIPPAGAEVLSRCQKQLGAPCPCGAKPLGRLNVMLFDGPVGVYQILIGGEQRLADVMTELVVFRRALGRLTNAVFEVERVQTDVQIRKDDGTRMARTGWPVHIRCNFTAKQALAASGVDMKALPGAVDEDEGDAAPHVDADGVVHETPTPTLTSPPSTPARATNGHGAPTLQQCEALACDLGMSLGDYRNYLVAVYGAAPSKIDPAFIVLEFAALEGAKGDPRVSAGLVAAMRAKARTVTVGASGGRP